MGVKNTVFFLDLNTLNKNIDEKLKEFAKSEDLDERDVVKIIYSEARKIGEKDKVKVTFKIMDGDEDSFRIIVEPANIKYKGTVIYPYQKVKSDDFEFVLDSVCGKVTLYNKKQECRKITVTIDSVALDIFAMTYKKAKEFLKDISDRKEKGGYIEYPDSICFKQYGVKINADKSDSADVKVDAPIASIDVYNNEEFFKEFYFEELKPEEKYDVNIPLPDEYNYEKKKTTKKNVVTEVKKAEVVPQKNQEIEIELPKEEVKVEENNNQEQEIDKRQAELEKIRQKQDEELERVKNKLKRELEEELNKSIKKYDEQNEKRLKQEIKEEVKEVKAEEKKIEEKNPLKLEIELLKEDLKQEQERYNLPEDTMDIDEQNIRESIKKYDEKNELRLKQELKQEIEKVKEEEQEIEDEIAIEEIDELPEDIKVEEIVEEENTDNKEEIKEEVQVEKIEENKEELTQNQKEIQELEKLLLEGKKQQEILENRINAKLEELKAAVKEESKETNVIVQEATEPIKVVQPEGYMSYTIESYKGIKEEGKEKLSLYFGQDKKSIRKYFGGNPKEIRDYDEMEMYDIFYAYYDEEDKCTGIGIYNQEVYKDKIALYMFGKNLITMKYRDIVKLIKKNDYNAIEDDDGIISLKYGISVDPKESTNYKDEISDVIHIFKKGYYDEVYENF
jgi:hypothetical protein